MNIALCPTGTVARSLALSLFDQHRRAGSTSVHLEEIPGFLHELKTGTDNQDEQTPKVVLAQLAVLAFEAPRLPWDGFIGTHIADAASLSVAARLLAALLPQVSSPGLGLGIVPLEAGTDPAELLGLMHDFAQHLTRTAAHLNSLLVEAAHEWVDPHALAGDVADIHDLARGYLTAARLRRSLNLDIVAR